MKHMEETRVIVCGGRTFSDMELCYRTLDQVLADRTNIVIVSGHARGADSFGEEYAQEHGLRTCIFKPDWKRYGRAAGPIRNREMLTYALDGKALIVAFWDGNSKGTRDMIRKGRDAGAEVIVTYYAMNQETNHG